MSLIDIIKQKHAKSFLKEAHKRIEDHQFSCFIGKPFYYIYSLDMINEELKEENLFISQVYYDFPKINFIVTRK